MKLQKLTSSDKDYLFSVLQKYLYELAFYYHDELDAQGNIAYSWFDSYFEDPTREAYVFVEGSRVLGFAMLNTHSDLGEAIDHALAEFTIFPAYRNRHKGRDAALLLFEEMPGTWELTYHNQNEVAAAFWMSLTKDMDAQATPVNGAETILSFTVD